MSGFPTRSRPLEVAKRRPRPDGVRRLLRHSLGHYRRGGDCGDDDQAFSSTLPESQDSRDTGSLDPAQWQATYQFPFSNTGYVTKKGHNVLRQKFRLPPSKNDRFKINNCKNDRERKLLWFLVPILSPDKPTTSTIKLMNVGGCTDGTTSSTK